MIGSQRGDIENKQAADPEKENKKQDDLIIEDVEDMYNLDDELSLHQDGEVSLA